MAQNWLKNLSKSFAETVYKQFGSSSGKMLLVTSAIGVALSTLAQAGAILFNDKYSVSQKAFMIPQELTEGVISIASLFIITTPIQMLAKKYSTTGKVLTRDLKNYMQKHNIMDKRGSLDFNLKTHIESTIDGLKNSDVFIKSTDAEKLTTQNYYTNILQKYNVLEDTNSAIATAAGSILSTAVILPYLRNYSASYYQKINMKAYDAYQAKKQMRNNIYNQKLYSQIPQNADLKV